MLAGIIPGNSFLKGDIPSRLLHLRASPCGDFYAGLMGLFTRFQS
jgi:hypothetical protein